MTSCWARFIRWLCPCLVPAEEEPEPLVTKRQLQSKIMVVGNIAVGKSTLIKCLVSNKSMRGVEVQRTLNFEMSDSYTIELKDEQAALTINFNDVAGTNAATQLIAQFAPRSNMIIICYSTEN